MVDIKIGIIEEIVKIHIKIGKEMAKEAISKIEKITDFKDAKIMVLEIIKIETKMAETLIVKEDH